VRSAVYVGIYPEKKYFAQCRTVAAIAFCYTFDMKNKEVARVFNEIADLLEIKGDNPFRIRAYRRAALNIETLSKDVSNISQDELTKIPGLGKDLAGKVEEYVQSGKISSYEALKKEVPEGLGLLLSVPGLGPKTVKLLFDELNVTCLEDLEHFAEQHTLSRLPGIKEALLSVKLFADKLVLAAGKRKGCRRRLYDLLPWFASINRPSSFVFSRYTVPGLPFSASLQAPLL